MEKSKFLLIIGLSLFFKISFVSASDSVNVYQMAVTGVPISGLGVTFTSFSAPTAGDRDTDGDTGFDAYLFIASTSNGNSGVYTYDAYYNDFYDVADTTTAAPTGGNFASFSHLSSGLGAVGFIATDTNGMQGVYGIGNIPLTLIATPNTSPAMGVTFGNIYSISVSGYFYGSPACDIESDAGSYLAILNSGDSYSFYGGTNNFGFSDFGPVSYKGSIGNSNVPGFHSEADAFDASKQGIRGVYFSGPTSDTNYLTLANIGGSTPNGTSTFTSFGNPVVTTNEVTFAAHYTTTGSDDQQGIFVYGPYEDIGNSPHLHQIVATGQGNKRGHSSMLKNDECPLFFLVPFSSFKQGSGGLTLNNIRVPTVNVNVGTLVIASSGHAAATSVVSSLSIPGGATFDLTNNTDFI